MTNHDVCCNHNCRQDDTCPLRVARAAERRQAVEHRPGRERRDPFGRRARVVSALGPYDPGPRIPTEPVLVVRYVPRRRASVLVRGTLAVVLLTIAAVFRHFA